MSKTLRTQTDFGIAFGRASAKAQHRENGSHAVTSSCLACAASGARGRQSALESSGEPRSGWVRSERERGRYVISGAFACRSCATCSGRRSRSRPARCMCAGPRAVRRQRINFGTGTRGFAAPEDPTTAVCLLPYRACLFQGGSFDHSRNWRTDHWSDSRNLSTDQQGTSASAS